MASASSIEDEVTRVAERAIRESRLAGGAPLGILDGIEAFLAAIHWDEPLVLGLAGLQVAFLATAILTRKNNTAQMVLLVLALAGVLSASRLNAYGSTHWREWGVSQNYFDTFGVFVSCMLSLPLIITSFGILLNAVVRASNMLVKVKRKQLGVERKQKAAHDARKQKEAEQSAGTNTAAATSDVAESSSTDAAASTTTRQRTSARIASSKKK